MALPAQRRRARVRLHSLCSREYRAGRLDAAVLRARMLPADEAHSGEALFGRWRLWCCADARASLCLHAICACRCCRTAQGAQTRVSHVSGAGRTSKAKAPRSVLVTSLPPAPGVAAAAFSIAAHAVTPRAPMLCLALLARISDASGAGSGKYFGPGEKTVRFSRAWPANAKGTRATAVLAVTKSCGCARRPLPKRCA